MTSQRILQVKLDDLMPRGRNPEFRLPTRDKAPKNTFSLEELLSNVDSSHIVAELLTSGELNEISRKQKPNS